MCRRLVLLLVGVVAVLTGSCGGKSAAIKSIAAKTGTNSDDVTRILKSRASAANMNADDLAKQLDSSLPEPPKEVRGRQETRDALVEATCKVADATKDDLLSPQEIDQTLSRSATLPSYTRSRWTRDLYERQSTCQRVPETASVLCAISDL